MSRANGPARPVPSGAVVITGASTGLGLESALHLAGEGFTVYATVRNLDQAPEVEKAAADRGVSVRVRQLDLRDQRSIGTAIVDLATEAGGIAGLVNNGGVGLRGCLEDTSDEEIRAVFEANVFGTIAVTKAALPYLRASQGRVITISSVGGRISSFGVSVYCASKFAQEGLAEGLALEVAPFGVRSILIEPGIIKTSRWSINRGTARGALDPDSPYRSLFAASEVIADRTVNRSRTTPADVARAVQHALTTEKPRLRYVVGRPAAAAIRMKRFLPEPVFEGLYFGGLIRGITRQARPVRPAGPPEPGSA